MNKRLVSMTEGAGGYWCVVCGRHLPDTLRKALQAQARRIDDTDCILSGRPWYVGA